MFTTDQLEQARGVVGRARAALGPVLGGSSPVDLLLDNLDWLRDSRQARLLYEAIEPLHGFLVMTIRPGYWGRGASVRRALGGAKNVRAGDRVRVFRCAPDAYVTRNGTIRGANQLLGTASVIRAYLITPANPSPWDITDVQEGAAE